MRSGLIVLVAWSAYTLNRMEAVTIAPCKVGEWVKTTLSQMESQVAGKPVRLVHRLPDDLAAFNTDEPLLKQTLINLVGNAIKFTESGEVAVTVEVEGIHRLPRAIVVSDTGLGIPK